MCSFDWLKRLTCLPPTSPSQSTTMTTVPNTTSLTTTRPQLQVAAATTTTHTPVNQGTAIQTPAKRRYSEQHHFQLSYTWWKRKSNHLLGPLNWGLKNWGHTSVYKMWKQVPSITWMINSKGGKIFFENSTCCCRYSLAQRRPRGCHILQIRILFKVVCLTANPFTRF